MLIWYTEYSKDDRLKCVGLVPNPNSLHEDVGATVKVAKIIEDSGLIINKKADG